MKEKLHTKNNARDKAESKSGQTTLQTKSLIPPNPGICFQPTLPGNSFTNTTSNESSSKNTKTTQLKRSAGADSAFTIQFGGSQSRAAGGDDEKKASGVQLVYGKKWAQERFGMLKENTWKLYIDKKHQMHGKDIYDTGAHRKDEKAEPGFLGSMMDAHALANTQIGDRMNASSYSDIHAAAMKHGNHVFKRKGYEYSVEMAAANVNEGLRKEIGKLKLVNIVPERKGVLRCVFKYGTGDEAQLRKKLDKYFNRFYDAIEKIKDPAMPSGAAPKAEHQTWLAQITKNKADRLLLIATLHKQLEYLHPFTDGNTRTNLVVLNKILVEYGFYPVIFENPNDSYEKTNAEWAQEIKRANDAAVKEVPKEEKDDDIEDVDDFEAVSKAPPKPAAAATAAAITTTTTTQTKSFSATASGIQFTIQKKENKTGLPDNLKSGIENLSGMDISDVKVHYTSAQPAQLNAHAYAQGNQIHVASGQEKHLPHEAWHVVQQKQGRVKPTKQLKSAVNINDDAHLEKEADVMGAKAVQFKSRYTLPVAEKTGIHSFNVHQQKLYKARELFDCPTQLMVIQLMSKLEIEGIDDLLPIDYDDVELDKLMTAKNPEGAKKLLADTINAAYKKTIITPEDINAKVIRGLWVGKKINGKGTQDFIALVKTRIAEQTDEKEDLSHEATLKEAHIADQQSIKEALGVHDDSEGIPILVAIGTNSTDKNFLSDYLGIEHSKKTGKGQLKSVNDPIAKEITALIKKAGGTAKSINLTILAHYNAGGASAVLSNSSEEIPPTIGGLGVGELRAMLHRVITQTKSTIVKLNFFVCGSEDMANELLSTMKELNKVTSVKADVPVNASPKGNYEFYHTEDAEDGNYTAKNQPIKGALVTKEKIAEKSEADSSEPAKKMSFQDVMELLGRVEHGAEYKKGDGDQEAFETFKKEHPHYEYTE